MTRFDPASLLVPRSRATDEGPIIRMSQRARELRARGMDVVSLTLGGIWLVSFVTVVAVVALAEFSATLRSRGHTPVALFGLLSGLMAVFAGYSGGAEAVGGLLAGAVIATVLFLSLVRRGPREFLLVILPLDLLGGSHDHDSEVHTHHDHHDHGHGDHALPVPQ